MVRAFLRVYGGGFEGRLWRADVKRLQRGRLIHVMLRNPHRAQRRHETPSMPQFSSSRMHRPPAVCIGECACLFDFGFSDERNVTGDASGEVIERNYQTTRSTL
jgi:hypothetical protein